jgi:lysophospholipase L1-like esterase
MRIAFFGASLTEGKYGGDFVAAAQAALPEHTLLNHGVAGHTINKLLDRVPDVLADAPDAVFVTPGSNDALAYVYPATRAYYKSQQGLPDGYIEPDAYAALFRDLCHAFMLEYVQVWVGLPPMEHSPAAVAASARFNQETRSVAEALDLPLFDFAARLNPPTVPERSPLTLQTVFQIGDRVKSGWSGYEAERAAGDFTYSFDGIHFTPETAQTVGLWLADWIRQQAPSAV